MTRIKPLVERGAYLGRAGAAIAAQPQEGVERTLERVAEWWDVRRQEWHYEADASEERLARLLGPLEPEEADGFSAVWETALDELRARGLEIGRGAYGGWDDGDVRLGRLAWWLARVLRPQFVVETGVARGLTTRVLLEALDRNGAGRLWSIDLPPLIEGELAGDTAAAVSDRLRANWTLLAGSSRRMLPGLVRGLGRVDLFVHDSMHTTRNVRFELDRVWPALAPGGAVLIDDVERNRATGDFVASHADAEAVICRAADGQALIGVVVKTSRGARTRFGNVGATRRSGRASRLAPGTRRSAIAG